MATSKKVKYVGTEQYINARTGEIEDFRVTTIEERDFDFHKVWMRSFITSIELVGNQKIRLAFWLIENLNKENQITMTYRQISQNSGISLDTVRKTMTILLESNFLKRVNNGCYMINPDVLFKGSRSSRLNVLNQYSDIATCKKKLSDEEQIASLTKAIEALQEELRTLTEKKQKEHTA